VEFALVAPLILLLLLAIFDSAYPRTRSYSWAERRACGGAAKFRRNGKVPRINRPPARWQWKNYAGLAYIGTGTRLLASASAVVVTSQDCAKAQAPVQAYSGSATASRPLVVSVAYTVSAVPSPHDGSVTIREDPK